MHRAWGRRRWILIKAVNRPYRDLQKEGKLVIMGLYGEGDGGDAGVGGGADGLVWGVVGRLNGRGRGRGGVCNCFVFERL